MKIEYRDSKPLKFSGNAIGNVELSIGINDIEVEKVRFLSDNPYFKSLVDKEIIILREALPVVAETLVTSETIEEDKPVIPRKRRASIDFSEEAE